MDASQITKLLQKQNTRYINRCQTVDASTLIWKNQIQSSKYIKGVQTCDYPPKQNCSVPTNPACDANGLSPALPQSVGSGICAFGGAGRTTALQTGSPQQFLSVYSGAAGSASQVYSSESITLQRAGKQSCGVPSVNPPPGENQKGYIVLPACYCVNTNGPTPNCLNTDGQENYNNTQLNNVCVPGNSTLTGNPNNLPINNQSNPYLPPFDTYYRFKNKIAQCSAPSLAGATGPPPTCQDQNQKHFVKECHSRFPNANNGVGINCSPCNNNMYMDPITKEFHTNPYVTSQCPTGVPVLIPPTCDGCVLEPVLPSIPYISYNVPSCPLNTVTPTTLTVILGPGTPRVGTFTITPPGPGSSAIQIDETTGILTLPGFSTDPTGIYTVTYTTVCGQVLTWSYDFEFCQISYDLPCFDPDAGIPIFPPNSTYNVSITGTLPPGGIYTITPIGPIIGDPINIDASTGAISTTTYLTGGTYLITYTAGAFVTTYTLTVTPGPPC